MTRYSNSPKNTRVRGNDSRGVALITTMLLLTVMIAMTLAMVIALTSDTLITGYYKTYRSSFYAGDSGVNVVRQYMLNQLVSNATVAVGTTLCTDLSTAAFGHGRFHHFDQCVESIQFHRIGFQPANQ